MRRTMVGLALLGFMVGACGEDVLAPLVPTPNNLAYELEPSGDPDAPMGILLFWDPVTSGNLMVYRIYSRPDDQAAFGLRGETTSITFHDNGIPDLEYFVVAVDVNDVESGASESVVIDERLRLESPDWLLSTSLNGAIHLAWSDNAYVSEPAGFKQYRIYSAPYDFDANLCDAEWGLEGTTVAPEFLVSALTNGAPICLAVTSESIEGYESLWSPIRADTPRPDARNIVLAAYEFDARIAGFRFWQDLNSNMQVEPNELGIVKSGDATDIDFRVSRDAGGNFSIVPIRAGTGVELYGVDPVADLTSIDYAPGGTYSTAPIAATPLYGYVFEMTAGDQWARYGAIRVTHVGRDYMIFDWSYQTDPGNPELAVGGGLKTAAGTGVVVER